MPREQWLGFIKDYDGGTLMECRIYHEVNYTDVPGMVKAQRAVRYRCSPLSTLSACSCCSRRAMYRLLCASCSKCPSPATCMRAWTTVKGPCRMSFPSLASVRSHKAGGVHMACDHAGCLTVSPPFHACAVEAGWAPVHVAHRRSARDSQAAIAAALQPVLQALCNHTDSWPFLEPVNPHEVPDYLAVVKNPIGSDRLPNP